jgi:lysophospholipase L1-like esterase
MRKVLATVAVAATIAAGLVAGPGPASGATADDVPETPETPAVPVRIMLAGDSITHGFDGDFTWRYRLFQEFGRQGVPVDFVGPRHDPYGGRGVYLVRGWDSDHDALGGSFLRDSVASVGGDVAAYQPDVLVAEYGTNDLNKGHTAGELLAWWRAYLANARAAAPDLAIVVGEVASPKAKDRAAANAGLHALAEELSTPTSPIVVADLESPAWVPSLHSRDRVHPNPTGETVIGQKVAEALQGLGILPEMPQVVRSFVPWTPPIEPVVRRRGHRLVVSWSRAQRLYRTHGMTVRVTSLRTGRSLKRQFDDRPRQMVTGPLRAGRYRVVLRGSRGTTRSRGAPGPLTTQSLGQASRRSCRTARSSAAWRASGSRCRRCVAAAMVTPSS